MKRWMTGTALLLLTACTSNPVGLNYYLLHQPATSDSEQSIDVSAQTTVLLNSLVVPDYLKQRNLSLQISSSELHFAPKHVWAEPFDSDFVLALNESLSAEHNIRLTTQRKWTKTAKAEYILDIKLDDFISTYNGKVILKGRYRLETDRPTPQIVQFSYSLPLTQDGFAYSVTQMRMLINQLADDVVNRIETKR